MAPHDRHEEDIDAHRPNAEALAVLDACGGLHDEFVFAKAGEPFRKIRESTRKLALDQTEITDFRWHDLRHTWASWHIMAGTPLHELMRLGGWKTYRMVLRYSHLSAEHLKGAAQRIEPPAVVPPPRSGRPHLRVVK